MSANGYVYAIRAEGAAHVKIGYSEAPELRLAGLATASPFPLRIVVQIKAPRFAEAALHNAFKDHRRHGEWFGLDEKYDPLLCDVFALVEIFMEAPTDDERRKVVRFARELAADKHFAPLAVLHA